MFKSFKSNKFGDRKDKRPSFGRSAGPVQMHPAVCSECHDDCEVPFRPNGRKPVLCSNCFRGSEEGSGRPERFERDSFRGERNERSERNERFEAPQGGDRSVKEVAQELRRMNVTLELILQALAKKAE